MRGQRVHSLVKDLVPDLAFWNRDGDLIAPQPLIERLAARTATPIDSASNTILRCYEGVIDETISGKHQSTMIRPLGVYHRLRRNFGQQVCPACLDEPKPYYRLAWRLYLFPLCTRHGTILIDSCPSCNQPIVAHRGGLTICHCCSTALTQSPLQQASASALQLQFHNEAVLCGGPVTWPGFRGLHPLAYFALQHALVRTLVAKKRGPSLRRQLIRGNSDCALPRHKAVRGNGMLSSVSLACLLSEVEMLMRGWPAMFVGHCQDAGVWSSWIMAEKHKIAYPHVLQEAVAIYLRPGSGPQV